MLEGRLQEIDERLAQLANYNLSDGIGSIGSRSRAYQTAEQREWFEIDLGAAVPLDQIVLVPAIRRDGKWVPGGRISRSNLSFRLLVGPYQFTGPMIAQASAKSSRAYRSRSQSKSGSFVFFFS